MELEEFVFQSITQIAKGIERAQEEAQGRYLVSPPHTARPNERHIKIKEHGSQFSDDLEVIDFDIAVTVSDKSSAGGKLLIPVFNLGGAHENENLNISRLKFQVLVQWPRQAWG